MHFIPVYLKKKKTQRKRISLLSFIVIKKPLYICFGWLWKNGGKSKFKLNVDDFSWINWKQLFYFSSWILDLLNTSTWRQASAGIKILITLISSLFAQWLVKRSQGNWVMWKVSIFPHCSGEETSILNVFTVLDSLQGTVTNISFRALHFGDIGEQIFLQSSPPLN